MLSAVDTLQLYKTNLAKAKSTIAADPQVKRDTEYFKSTISTVKSSKDFVGNYRLFSFAMHAYGLDEMTYAKSFMQKVMDGGIINPKSMANQLSDPRFRAFAKAFDFGDKGPSATSDASIGTDTAAAYVQQALEANAGQLNPGAQLALYFQRKAPTITSGMSILADKDLLQFAKTALNLSNAIGSSVDKDAKLIETKLDIKSLQDPAKVSALVQRFAAKWDAQNSTGTTSAALTLLTSTTQANSGINAGLLGSVQQHYTMF